MRGGDRDALEPTESFPASERGREREVEGRRAMEV